MDRKIETESFTNLERESVEGAARENKRRIRLGKRSRMSTKTGKRAVKDKGGVADVEPPDQPDSGMPTYTILYDDGDKEIVDTVDLYSPKYAIGGHFRPARKRKPRKKTRAHPEKKSSKGGPATALITRASAPTSKAAQRRINSTVRGAAEPTPELEYALLPSSSWAEETVRPGAGCPGVRDTSIT